MRLPQRLAIGLLALVTAALATVTVTPRRAWADSDASMTVSPSHGTATTPLTLVYRASRVSPNHPESLLPCSGSVTFFMDAPELGNAPLVDDGDYCAATLHTKPPADLHYDTPGAHTMRTNPASGTGYVALVYATYTIDASPAKTAAPNPTHGATKAAAPGPRKATTSRPAVAATARAATRPAAATPTATASGDLASDPASSATDSDSAGGPASTLPAIALTGASGAGARTWIVAVLGALVLGGAAGLGLVAHRRRRVPAE